VAVGGHSLVISAPQFRGGSFEAAHELVFAELDPVSGAQVRADDPALVEASSSLFLLRHQDYQSEENPGCCQDEAVGTEVSQCLTAGRAGDAMGGLELYYRDCEELSKLHPKVNDGFYKEQLFVLTLSGQFKSAASGLCIRRVLCTVDEDEKYAYDLGDCNDDDEPFTFQVEKVPQSDFNRASSPVYAVQAVANDACQVCGPYVVLEKCAGPNSFLLAGCPKHYEATPGWSKLPSQYVGDMAVQGYSGMTQQQVTDRIESVSQGSGLSQQHSIGPSLDHQGLCGTFAEDVPAFKGLYEFVKQPIKVRANR